MAKVASRRVFKIGSEEREIFMSFAMHQSILMQYGNPEQLNLVAGDPKIQTQIVAQILMGKNYPSEGVFADVLDYLDQVELDNDQASEILDWFFEHAVNFFEGQIQNLTTKLDKIKLDLQKLTEKTAESLTQ